MFQYTNYIKLLRQNRFGQLLVKLCVNENQLVV